MRTCATTTTIAESAASEGVRAKVYVTAEHVELTLALLHMRIN